MESEAHHKQNSSHNTPIFITIIVILLIAVVGEYFYFHMRTAQPPIGMMAGAAMHPEPRTGMRMAMAPVTPPPLSDQQTQQLAAGTDTATTKKTFNITGGNFYFVPNNITVNQGDEVTFVLTNAGGVHNVIIDELGVKTPVIKTANTATFKFTASKKGSFVYYCSVPGHREKGMWGTLVVQ